MPEGRWRQCQVVLAFSVLLWACAGTPERHGRGRYDFDSATSSCRQRPALCARVAGEETVVPAARAAEVVASTLRTGATVLRVLDAATRELVVKSLERCADEARSRVLDEVMGGRSPTPRECNELVDDPESRRRITRAMRLGCAMHQVALECTRKSLDTLLPGRFSLEQRYRYDRRTRVLTLISDEEARSLLRQGCGDELTGTLVPDVVIHAGDPLKAQAVYDFKFPCVNVAKAPAWKQYEDGPHQGLNQKNLYGEALGVDEVQRIVPRLGAVP